MVSSVQEGRAPVRPTAPAPLCLDLDLDALALEPFEHPLILLRRREPGPYRLPWPARPDAAVFRLLDADQCGLRHGVDRVVVRLVAELEAVIQHALAREGIELVHRHQPVARDALLRPIPEVALIARVRRDRAP